MPEIGTSGSMSGDGKRSVAAWPKLPRPFSTLPKCECRLAQLRLLSNEQRTQLGRIVFGLFMTLKRHARL